MKIWIIKTGEQTEHDANPRLLRSAQIFQTLKKVEQASLGLIVVLIIN